jgi:hypothetical protein
MLCNDCNNATVPRCKAHSVGHSLSVNSQAECSRVTMGTPCLYPSGTPCAGCPRMKAVVSTCSCVSSPLLFKLVCFAA